ncbi:hypothetical protein ACRU44_16960 [Mycobacterium colombiense]
MKSSTYKAIGIIAAVIMIAWSAGCATHNYRWSAFPHTMGCAVDTSPPDMPPEPNPPPPGIVNTYPPDMARAKQASLTHPSDQLVALSVEFGQPPKPQRMGYVIELMGSNGHKGSITIFSSPPDPGPAEWVAGRMDQSMEDLQKGLNHDPRARHNPSNLLTSVRTDGNVAQFVVDLTGQSELLGNGDFRPTIRIAPISWDVPPTADPLVLYYQQYCRWDTPVTGQSDPGVEATPAPANPGLAAQPPPTTYAPTSAPSSTAQPYWDGPWLRNYSEGDQDCNSRGLDYWVVQPGGATGMYALKLGCFPQNWVNALNGHCQQQPFLPGGQCAVWDQNSIMSTFGKRGDLLIVALTRGCLDRAGLTGFHEGPLHQDCVVHP